MLSKHSPCCPYPLCPVLHPSPSISSTFYARKICAPLALTTSTLPCKFLALSFPPPAAFGKLSPPPPSLFDGAGWEHPLWPSPPQPCPLTFFTPFLFLHPGLHWLPPRSDEPPSAYEGSPPLSEPLTLVFTTLPPPPFWVDFDCMPSFMWWNCNGIHNSARSSPTSYINTGSSFVVYRRQKSFQPPVSLPRLHSCLPGSSCSGWR